MEIVFRYWTGQDPTDMPIKTFVIANEEIEEIIEDHFEMMSHSFEKALREVLSDIL